MKPPFRFLTALVLAVPLCFAQAVLPPVSIPAPPQPAAQAVSEKAPDAANDFSKPYVFGPLDVVDIRVWNSPNLSGAFPIGPDGFLSLPLIGQIKADGLTQPELNKVITGRLESLMNNPEVNVQLVRNNSKKFYILGEVMRPGEYALLSDMTVLDALANCGGFREFANQKKIYVLRDNGKQRLGFNYNDVRKGKNMDQNVHLQSGDRIFVP